MNLLVPPPPKTIGLTSRRLAKLDPLDRALLTGAIAQGWVRPEFTRAQLAVLAGTSEQTVGVANSLTPEEGDAARGGQRPLVRRQGKVATRGSREPLKPKTENCMTPRTSSLVSGFSAVRIHPKLACPDCGRLMQPHDAVRIDDDHTDVICSGCHVTILELNRA